VALAEAAFGRVVQVAMSGGVLDGPFLALLDLQVPFDDLDRHREREACFTAMAGADPVLRRVPLIYVLSAAPAAAPVPPGPVASTLHSSGTERSVAGA
jgi:hypothetical protein